MIFPHGTKNCKKGIWRGMILNTLRRCWILYLLLFLIAVFGVDYHKTAVRTVDQLKDLSTTLYRFAKGDAAYKYVDVMLGVRYYKNIATLVPDPSPAYGVIGFCYYHMKDYSNAIKFYKKAVQGKKVFLGFYYNLGMAYYRRGKFKRAVESFQQALEADPLDTLVYPNMIFPSQPVITKAETGADIKKERMMQLILGRKKALKMITLSQEALEDSLKGKDDAGKDKLLENLYYYPPSRTIYIKGQRELTFM